MSGASLLEVQGLTVRFGGVTALDDVSLVIDEGALVGLIGPNGAGKTTFIDALTGFVSSRGHIDLANVNIDRASPRRRARLGLARTFQSIELFEDLTVRENVVVASEDGLWSGLTEPLRGIPQVAEHRVNAAIARVGLGAVVDRLPTELAHAERKLVGVARALARDPKLLLLDEPAAGLDRRTTERLGDQLRALRGEGTTMLLVDHDMELVLSVCDLVYVLDLGRLIAAGAPGEIRTDPNVIRAYLGEERVA